MYKLLIADDEPIERSSLGLIVSRAFEDVVIAGEAANGREAVALARDLAPDVVFLDIKMPGMNGIEAAQAIRAADSRVKIVIVTAYDYFEYARESLRIGVDDFLLKPVLKDNVTETLTRLLVRIDAERKQKETADGIKLKLKEMRVLVETELVSALLANPEEDQVREYLDLLDLRFGRAYGMVVSVKENSLHAADRIFRKMFIRNVYERAARKAAEAADGKISAVLNGRLYLVLFQGKEESDYELRASSLRLADGVSSFIKTETGADVRIGIGKTYGGAAGIFYSLKEAELALDFRDGSPEGSHFGDLNLDIVCSSYPLEEERRLCERVAAGDAAEARDSLRPLLGWALVNAKTIQEIRHFLLGLTVMVTRAAAAYKEIEREMLDASGYYDEIKAVNQAKEAENYLVRLVAEVSERVGRMRRLTMNEQIAKAAARIHKNYERDLSLEEVAEAVNLSPTYFSKLFKAETGENFIDYLTKHRMTAAGKLLLSGVSVKEVSYRVGYNSPNYFSKLFKKHFGVSPSDYQDEPTKTDKNNK